MRYLKIVKKFKLFFLVKGNPAKIESLTKKGVKIFILKKKDYNLKRILEILAELGISNLLVEGGQKFLAHSFKQTL